VSTVVAGGRKCLSNRVCEPTTKPFWLPSDETYATVEIMERVRFSVFVEPQFGNTAFADAMQRIEGRSTKGHWF